jgi:Zn-dependent M28 family amino/carboxypeptidase
VLDAVRIDSMMRYVNELSGELPVNIGNGPELIASRHTFNAGNAMAQTWLEQKFVQLGYDPVVQTFSSTGRNILVTKPGSIYPDEVVILCAHYDAMPAGVLDAPAADDDGSGCGAVLEAARILRDIDFAYTIVFALWDEEEQGLLGAKFYAGAMAANDAVIRGVINMDAIAYDGNADKKARIHVRPIANSVEIGDSIFAVRAHYGIDLDLLLTNPGATYSDHAAFWTEGFGAVLVIEEFGADGNPFYHTPNDRAIHFDVPYYEKLAKLSIATLATLAEPTDIAQVVTSPQATPSLTIQAYPNPSSISSHVWLDVPVAGTVSLVLFDALGREVMGLFSGQLSPGRHTFEVLLGELPAGSYTLLAQGGGLASRSLRLMRTP